MRFCAWPAVFSSGSLTRKPTLLDFPVFVRPSDFSELLGLLGHDCALSVPCARTTCFSAQKGKKWFNNFKERALSTATEWRWYIWAGKLPQYLLCPVHTVAKEKLWKFPFSYFFLLLKETWQLPTIVNECKCSEDSDCALGIFWIERRLVLTCFPCRTRTVLFPLDGDLSWCLRKWKKWLTWFLLAVPKSHY